MENLADIPWSLLRGGWCSGRHWLQIDSYCIERGLTLQGIEMGLNILDLPLHIRQLILNRDNIA